MPPINLRQRIAFAIAAACICIVAALGMALYAASEEMEDALVEQIVAEEIDHLIERRRQIPDYQPQAGPSFQYYVSRSPDDAGEMPAELRALPSGFHEVRVGGEERHVAVRLVGDTRYAVAYDVGPHEDRELRFRYLLALSLASVAVISLVLGYWLAGLLTRQLTELARKVHALTPATPHGMLVSPTQDAEVATLARALDNYQTRIARMIEREQEFTANASHELRTPLTAIRTSCELLLSENALPDSIHRRVVMIDDAAHRMTDQLETLLLVARDQPLAASEPLALARCVDDALDSCRDEIARKGLELRVSIDPGITLKANRQALHTVLTNLLRNAVRYTDHGSIHVRFTDGTLTVADSGRGIAADDLPRLFQRFYRGSGEGGGFGLGLAIAHRICEQNGWRIGVESRPGAGSAFSISFS